MGDQPDGEQQSEIAELRQFFAALSDESGLKVAGVLATRYASVADLAGLLSLREADVLRRLSLLESVGVVTSAQADGSRVYRLDTRELRERRKRLLARERSSSPADQADSPEWERLVLRNFFDGERLKEIPANLKKRMVVLTWLADRFELGNQYPEREVNEIIKRHHPDASALRRELVDHRFMARENGVYWRIERPAVDHASERRTQ